MDSRFITNIQNCQKTLRNDQRMLGGDLMHSEPPRTVPSLNNAHLKVWRQKPATKALGSNHTILRILPFLPVLGVKRDLSYSKSVKKIFQTIVMHKTPLSVASNPAL